VKAQTAFVLSRMQKPQASSSFSALANVAFFRLWVAALASGTAVAADQTAARWALIHFSESAFVISLLSSTAALPFLLFTLPAGFVADAVDRRPLLRTINVWQALVAGTLAFLGFRGMLSPATLLVGSLALGVGFAFNAPVWTALIPDVVPEDELPFVLVSALAALPFTLFAGTLEAVTLEVKNMTCAVCPITVKKALEKVPGVTNAKVDFDKETASVTFDPDKTSAATLTKATSDAGYPSTVRN
jgi:mercuric ion binding protein